MEKVIIYLMAKSPRARNSEKAFTHMGLEGINSTIAPSPDLPGVVEEDNDLKNLKK